MNVTELARQLKIHNKEKLFEIINELGFDIGKRAIKVDDSVARKIISLYKQKARDDAKKQSSILIKEKAKEIAKEKKDIEIPMKITVKGLSELVSLPVTEIIKILMQNGIMASINENIDAETACIIAEDLGYKAHMSNKKIQEDEDNINKIKNLLANQKKSINRPPVVVVMGHVDHGKTKLLDAIRKTNIVDKEAGGITQHIGAYQVMEKDQLITFIDTPGHEAFTAMRSRGANVADLAILVVAADDGIKPQTIEAIEIMGKSNLPFIVAINKIDKPGADIDKVKKELAELNLTPEDWGGKTICVEISAKRGTNIDKLLEMLLLLTEMEKENIQADPKTSSVGTIIESHIDKGEGPVATVIVQNGTLKIGDLVQVGKTAGKIKSLFDWKNIPIRTAPPSTPVKILGLKSAPTVGDILEEIEDKKILKKIPKKSNFQPLNEQGENDQKTNGISEESNEQDDKKQINLIIKTDALGPLEAIIASIEKIQNQEVAVNIVHEGLGNITEKDIAHAEPTNAPILGFNVKTAPNVLELASKAKIEIELFDIIYKLLDYIEEEINKKIEPKISYDKIGELKVLAIFKSTRNNQIIGGKVIKNIIKTPAIVKITRNENEVGTGEIIELQCNKQKTNKASKDSECGLSIKTDSTINENDILEIFEEDIEKKNKK